jgi:hypothetical protein
MSTGAGVVIGVGVDPLRVIVKEWLETRTTYPALVASSTNTRYVYVPAAGQSSVVTWVASRKDAARVSPAPSGHSTPASVERTMR